MDIHEKENQLFRQWEEYVKERLDSETVDDLFCYDGLHYTGEPDKSSGYWLMQRDYREEELWNNAFIRPAFLTKDHNLNGDEEGVDIRTETGMNNDNNNVYHAFYARYLQLMYGLGHIDPHTYDCPSFEEASQKENYLSFFHHDAAVVRINVKKIAGYESCPHQLLQEYVLFDQEYIRRQLGLYRPNVIICCDGSDFKPNQRDVITNPIMEMLFHFYPDLKAYHYPEDEYNFIYFSEAEKVIVLHEWHPSSRSVSYHDYYLAIPQLCKFLKQHLQFLQRR